MGVGGRRGQCQSFVAEANVEKAASGWDGLDLRVGVAQRQVGPLGGLLGQQWARLISSDVYGVRGEDKATKKASSSGLPGRGAKRNKSCCVGKRGKRERRLVL